MDSSNIVLRKINDPEEIRQVKINSAVAFNYHVDPDSDKIKDPIPDTDIYGIFEDNKLVSHMYVHKYQMMCHGRYVPMCGIGSVCSVIGHRNKGHIRRLFKAVFDDVKSASYIYSYLYPFSFKYYKQFGYGYGGSRVKAEIPLDKFTGFECNYDFSLYNIGDAYEPYKEVFEKFSVRYSGTVERRCDEWLKGYDPAKTSRSMYLFKENGDPKAFLGYKNFYDKGGQLEIHNDIAWDSPEALRNIFGFLYRLRMHNSKVIMTFPEDLPFDMMLSDPLGIKTERYLAAQVRIIDAKEAIRIYPWQVKECSFKIGIRDEYYSEQNCVFEVVIDESGTVSVEKCDGEPDIYIDISVLSSLLMGVYGFDDLVYYKPELVRVNKNHSLLRSLFTRKPVFFTEPF